MSTTFARESRSPRAGGAADEHDWRQVAAVAAGLEVALEARAPGVYIGTPLVRKLAVQVSRHLGLDDQEQLAVDICARIRDIGMISLPDSVILNTGVLSPSDQALLQRHPALGADLLESLPMIAAAAGIVRAHHERWDGQGYPDRLHGDAIPLPSRVVAVCDAFVAVATDRPFRPGIGAVAALDYIRRHRGSQFDPQIVDCLIVAIAGERRTAGRVQGGATERSVERPGDDARTAPAHAEPTHAEPTHTEPARTAPPRTAPPRLAPPRARGLTDAIAEFDLIPAFGPACDQALAAVAGRRADGPVPIVEVVERDIGLTVAVLRRAQTTASARPITNVADAVARLSGEEIATTIASLPRAAFPWHTRFEALLLHCQAHSRAVARAAQRLAQMTTPFDTEDVVAAALLHDVGKLLLARARPGYVAPNAARCTPSERARAEQRELGIDHASLGGLMLERWGLPQGLAAAVSRHHSRHPANGTAALVRLADMVAHHAQGNAVDRTAMMRLADDRGLPVDAIRDAVFDQPRVPATARRRAERSPLSDRETTVLRLVANGRRNSNIAEELKMSVSTVRSHLHNINAKLDVRSPAQAVIRASEMAWL